MKILFIGGTGNISSAVSRLAIAEGHDLTLLNRGRRPLGIDGAESVVADIKDETSVRNALGSRNFDVVANFIGFTPEDIERDLRLFAGRCAQYIFISSASAYAKPPGSPFLTESSPLKNIHWQYSRNKIACENRLTRAYREQNFPATIIRPSLTYDTVIPLPFGAWNEFTVIDRIRAGKPLIVHGDGTSLWTITHAEDFAVGMAGLLGHQLAIGEAFHITSDEVLNWDQIHDAVCAAAGGRTPYVHIPSEFIAKLDPGKTGSLLGDKAQSVIFDNRKIKRFVPGFTARIPFAAGIRRTLEWFEADPARCMVKPESDARIDAIIEKYLTTFNSLEPLP